MNSPGLAAIGPMPFGITIRPPVTGSDTNMNDTTRPPLAGIRILDFSRVIAGPLATQQLADLGATVIKVENPVTGDEVRGVDANGEPARSPFFIAFNRSKQSVAIDLRSAAGQALARDLATRCDVLVQNYRPGVMERFGLDHTALEALNPSLVYVSVSAYGEHTTMRTRPGFDPVLQAESGMMELTGEPDGPPMRTALSLIDTLTAAHLTTAVLAALMSRADTGRGDYIDLALMDTAMAALGNMGSTWLATGTVPQRAGNNHIHSTPNGLFRTATEPMYIAVGSNRLFGELCSILGTPGLAEEERFATPGTRLSHRDELRDTLEARLMTEPADHWVSLMRDLPAGKVRTLDAAYGSPEVAERDLVHHIDDGDEAFALVRSPFQFRQTPVAQFAPPPRLGEHTRSALRELLGLTDQEVDELAEAGTIRCT